MSSRATDLSFSREISRMVENEPREIPPLRPLLTLASGRNDM